MWVSSWKEDNNTLNLFSRGDIGLIQSNFYSVSSLCEFIKPSLFTDTANLVSTQINV